MKFQVSEKSLFALLLRSPWWISFALAAAMALLGWTLVPEAYRIPGALSCFPFVLIGVMAAWRQRNAPSAARVAQTAEAVGTMNWPVFAGLLEQAFQRDHYTVQRRGGAADFELERQGRRTLVSARRWKSARTGLEPLRELQAAREADDVSDAVYVGLGALSDQATAFATQHRIAVWQAAELAQALRGVALQPGAKKSGA